MLFFKFGLCVYVCEFSRDLKLSQDIFYLNYVFLFIGMAQSSYFISKLFISTSCSLTFIFSFIFLYLGLTFQYFEHHFTSHPQSLQTTSFLNIKTGKDVLSSLSDRNSFLPEKFHSCNILIKF